MLPETLTLEWLTGPPPGDEYFAESDPEDLPAEFPGPAQAQAEAWRLHHGLAHALDRLHRAEHGPLAPLPPPRRTNTQAPPTVAKAAHWPQRFPREVYAALGSLGAWSDARSAVGTWGRAMAEAEAAGTRDERKDANAEADAIAEAARDEYAQVAQAINEWAAAADATIQAAIAAEVPRMEIPAHLRAAGTGEITVLKASDVRVATPPKHSPIRSNQWR